MKVINPTLNTIELAALRARDHLKNTHPTQTQAILALDLLAHEIFNLASEQATLSTNKGGDE